MNTERKPYLQKERSGPEKPSVIRIIQSIFRLKSSLSGSIPPDEAGEIKSRIRILTQDLSREDRALSLGLSYLTILETPNTQPEMQPLIDLTLENMRNVPNVDVMNCVRRIEQIRQLAPVTELLTDLTKKTAVESQKKSKPEIEVIDTVHNGVVFTAREIEQPLPQNSTKNTGESDAPKSKKQLRAEYMKQFRLRNKDRSNAVRRLRRQGGDLEKAKEEGLIPQNKRKGRKRVLTVEEIQEGQKKWWKKYYTGINREKILKKHKDDYAAEKNQGEKPESPPVIPQTEKVIPKKQVELNPIIELENACYDRRFEEPLQVSIDLSKKYGINITPAQIMQFRLNAQLRRIKVKK